MSENKNFFFTLDANTNAIYGFNDSHQDRGPTKEEWIAYMTENFEQQMNFALDQWQWLIEKHPDRFMWGTDRWYGWHFDPQASALIEEYSRALIARLNPSVQEKFAHQNAENLLSK